MLRRYTATYDAEKAAQAHASFNPADPASRAGLAAKTGPPGVGI